jgi:NAD(P)-dependent dehydrogenase (short-subunit alcohol dehydrogenase family)
MIVANVADSNRTAEAIDETVARLGALHYAVNNAGIASEAHDLPDLPVAVWDRTVAVNLSALYYCMRAEIPAIANSGGGAIVNISSVYGDRGLPNRAAYSASKHGIRGLTRSAAIDWAARGVRINELQPGVIDTPMLAGATPERRERVFASIAAKRLGSVQEIATTAVAFLLSDDASYITGAHLAVDGGFLA